MADSGPHHGPLHGVRVLDLSRVLAGPWAGQTLADLGAEVIKVEHPGHGDDTRAWGPPYARDATGADTTVAAYYLAANRGKRGITIDFAQPAGAALVRQLAAQSDVLIENFKVGGLAKFGLDYPALKAVNPRLVYCSITGFGQSGPYAQRPGYDFMIQGLGGLMSLTGSPDDQPGGGPFKVGVAVADLFTGLYATVGILAALAHRDRTGEGQQVDMALLDVQVAMLANQALNGLVSGNAPQRLGNAHPNIVPYQSFATRDGHIIVAVGNDAQFRRLCTVLDCPALVEDARSASNALRVTHRAFIVTVLQARFATRDSRDWLEVLETAAIPCGPINDLPAVFADPQVQARDLIRHLPHPEAGTVPTVANPIRLSATPLVCERAPPGLGADTDAVLRERLGLSTEQIMQLRAAGVV